MTPFTQLTSKVAVLPVDDVDTDQIVPARFLKGTVKHGLGAQLFADWRGRVTFLDRTDVNILLTGRNFGCGSSREHAPWALVDFGFRAIIAQSFADIFRQNATKNGLLTITLAPEECARIEQAVTKDPAAEVHVDLATGSVRLPDGTTFSFSIDPFARHCLLNGIDELGYILSFEDRIKAHEERTGL
jgi:3-isopropylmalate/(R)-2-methylmalate dehydratase small subunit